MDREIWLILIGNEKSVQDAFTLANSIRRVCSNRKIYALLGEPLACDLGLPEELFDGRIILPDLGPSVDTTKDDFYAKIFCLSLDNWNKICFMTSNCFVVRNCDAIFDTLALGSSIVTFTERNYDCFLLRPCRKIFREYCDRIKLAESQADFTDFTEIFNEVVEKFGGGKSLENTLKNYWFAPLTSPDFGKYGNVPAIVSLGLDPTGKSSSLSELQQKICNYVNDVRMEPQLPQIMNCADGNEPIAIVGISCRLPGSNNEDEYWDLLMSQGSGMSPVPPHRWNQKQSCVVDEDSSKREAGFLNCPIDEFDDSFFEMSPAELKYTDPQQRLLLEVGYEALQDAGISRKSLTEEKIGIFTGAWAQDYRDLLTESGFRGSEFFRTYLGNSFGSSSARLSFFLGATGPNIAIESGCSASNIAIKLACDSLRKGESNVALACGVNLLVRPFRLEDMAAVCSPTNMCKSFDASADGFARAEGVAVLVLKKLSDAIRDEDKIRGVFRGIGVSQDGQSKSMGTPTKVCETLAMSRALSAAKILPTNIGFLEGHFTGTSVGDPIEAGAIRQAYTGLRKMPLIVGSVKSNIGHTEACSGMASIIKVVKSLANDVIPPQRLFTVINPAIIPEFEAIPAEIPLVPKKWPRSKDIPRIAGVSSFGISGCCTHVVMQEPPLPTGLTSSVHTFPQNIVTISAKTKDALNSLLTAYKKYFEDGQEERDIQNVAYSLNVGRDHFNHRIALVTKTMEDLIPRLSNTVNVPLRLHHNKNKPSGLCFMFTGQGSQYHGMGAELYLHFKSFRDAFDSCENYLMKHFQISVKLALWGAENGKQLLQSAMHSQSSIFTLNYALSKLFESLRPDFVVGHSLGEFNAAVAAGLMSFEDALFLLASRGRLVDTKLTKGSMIALQSEIRAVLDIKQAFETQTGKWLDIAAENSKNQIVLAGSSFSVSEFKVHCTKLGIVSTILDSAYAYHSRDMEDIAQELRTIGEGMPFPKRSSESPIFISSAAGCRMDRLDAQYWCDQTRNKVQFQKAFTTLSDAGARQFIELGSTSILCNLVKQNLSEKEDLGQTPSTTIFCQKRGSDNFEMFLNAVANLYNLGYDINWQQFHSNHAKRLVKLPFYPFQRVSHWFPPTIRGAGHLTNYKNPDGGESFVGDMFENPSGTRIFHRHITFNSIPWIKDHAIGDTVICPGAFYVEIGLAVARHLKLPLCLKDLKIEAAWGVNSEETDQSFEIQTIVENLESPPTTKVSIYTRKFQTPTWTRHAQLELGSKAQFKIPEIRFQQDVLHLPRTLVKKNVYAILQPLGYNFGPCFRTVESVLQGSDDFLVELTLPEIIVGPNPTRILHPILIDAMLQAVLFSKSKNITQLRVPVAVEAFEMNATAPIVLSSKAYVHVHGQNFDFATLYTEDGAEIANLRGLVSKETSLQSLDRLFKKSPAEKFATTPPMFREIWAPTSNNGLPPFPSCDDATSSDLYRFIRERITVPSLASLHSFQALNRGIGDAVLRSLIELPSFQSCSSFDAKTVMKWLRIQEHSHTLQLIRRLLEMLEEDGWLQLLVKGDNGVKDTFKISKRPLPTASELDERINKAFKEGKNPTNPLRLEWEFGMKFTFELINILQGTVSPLELLFTGKDKTYSAEKFYDEATFALEANNALSTVFEELIKRRYNSRDYELRILEIGGGTGSATSRVLPILKKYGSCFQYTFTDISSSFFPAAEKKFKDYDGMIYKSLNIEESPLDQRLPPFYYDILVCSNVLHATRDLSETTGHIRQILKHSGHLLILETFIPQRYLDVAVGHLDGYWRQVDKKLRPSHCVIDKGQWEVVLQTAGFSNTTSIAVCHGGLGVVLGENGEGPVQLKTPSDEDPVGKWMILCQTEPRMAHHLGRYLKDLGKSAVLLPMPLKADNLTRLRTQFLNSFQGKRIEGFVYIQDFSGLSVSPEYAITCLSFLQAILQWKNIVSDNQQGVNDMIKVVLAMPNAFPIASNLPPHPSGGELIGLMKVFASENPGIQVKIVDFGPRIESLLQELFHNFTDLCVAFRDNIRLTVTLQETTFTQSHPSLELPRNNFRITLPPSRAITDVSLAPMEPEKGAISPHQIRIQIHAFGLNVQDLFLIFQTVVPKDAGFGCDISGQIIEIGSSVSRFKVGDFVCAVRNEDPSPPLPLASVAIMDANQVASVPPTWTMEQACAIPVAFFTSYHCLVTIGQMKPGEVLLLHAASGGVGLCSIQIAAQIGVTIIATAGSKRKRNFLKGLGIRHVLDSRSLEFEKQVGAITQGIGVHVVLNSLTGPGFKEASLSCLRLNGKFIEMGKINIWDEEQVRKIRPDVTYQVVDLSESSRWRFLNGKLEEYMTSGLIRPIPYSMFDVRDISEALYFQQGAKHIGKVVLKFPLPEQDSHNNLPAIGVKSHLFNSRSSYLITGGTRGIGLALAEWMVTSQGAKWLILAARSPPPPESLKTIKILETDYDACIHVVQVNVGNYDEVKASIFDESPKNKKDGNLFPPIRGIMHAAGYIRDAVLLDQDESSFATTFQSKVIGTWNLHQLTRNTNLEHFVLFSSISAILGSPGQANHASANSWMDSFAAYRASIGLPALSINWGQWGQVGIVAGREIHGFTPFSTSAALNALEKLLRNHTVNAGVLDGDVSKWVTLWPWTTSYLKNIKSLAGRSGDGNIKKDRRLGPDDTAQFWSKYNKCESTGDETTSRMQLLRSNVAKIVSIILQMNLETGGEDEDEIYSKELHLDSLMVIELRNMVQNMLGDKCVLSVGELLDCSTINGIATQLRDAIKKRHQEEDRCPKESNNLTNGQPPLENNLRKLIREDSILWKNTFIPPGNPGPVPLSKIQTILLTGVTGNLGPYLLKIISNLPSIQKIFCLVREQPNHLSPKARIHSLLKQFNIGDSVDMDKVFIITGELTQSNFGLSESEYNTLAGEIDCIFHIAAHSNHLEDYQSFSEGAEMSQLRSVNIFGTQRVLKFATETKTKWVFYTSSITALQQPNRTLDGIPEDWLELDDFNESCNFGYGISKFVAELLIKEAVLDRGLPIKAFRLPLLCGESGSGGQNVLQNHFFLKYVYYLQKGIMPPESVPMYHLPVDVCARLCCQLFFDDMVPADVYNVVNPGAIDEQDLPGIAAELGVEVRVVPYPEWVRVMEQDPFCLLRSVRPFYTGGEEGAKYKRLLKTLTYIDAWKINPKNFFLSRKVQKYIPDIHLIVENPKKIFVRDVLFVVRNTKLLPNVKASEGGVCLI